MFINPAEKDYIMKTTAVSISLSGVKKQSIQNLGEKNLKKRLHYFITTILVAEVSSPEIEVSHCAKKPG
jgi:hypothetical protein